jgi:hypothetical protein
MNLFDSPTLKALMATLPADADRMHAEGVYLKRERQLHTLHTRAAAIRARCAAIAEALPDASTKQAKELHNERRDLMAEQAALPVDLTVTAGLYADALSAYLQATERVIASEAGPLRASLEATYEPLREAEYALSTCTPGERAYDARHAALMEIARERQPHGDRLEALEQRAALLRAFLSDALETTESALRPGGVKLIAGRPTEAHRAAFVAQAAQAA